MRCPCGRCRADRADAGDRAATPRRRRRCWSTRSRSRNTGTGRPSCHPRSLEIFEALGIVDEFLAAGAPQRAARLHSAGEVLVEVDFSRSGAPYAYNVGLSEEATEGFLAAKLESLGGSVERATRFLRMTQDDDGVTATVIERGGREEEVRAKWIVGCGGYHSPVREALGIEMEGHDIEDSWAVFDVTLAGREDDFETTLVYLEETMVILTPLPGHRFRVYTRPTGDDADFVAEATAVLARYLPDQELTQIENPSRFRCHAKVASRYREGRALLAGDAAHVCSPSQGHGMNSGIGDAFNLGWKLALVCEGDADRSCSTATRWSVGRSRWRSSRRARGWKRWGGSRVRRGGRGGMWRCGRR